MSNKHKRLTAIREIIRKEKIASQEELLHKLGKKGYKHTQATLSRDLKILKVSKIPDDDYGYVYVLPNIETSDKGDESIDHAPVKGLLALEFNQNLGVIKTLPGYANSIAYAIDNLDSPYIIGTIAGDDTILVIPREYVTKEEIKSVISTLFPYM